ncbi:hypothetical protein HDU80_000402 [Chytriomyces hyalinus]|nr:hypothetical protein HDU80_000402 [Chytriomyces hyalinus]
MKRKSRTQDSLRVESPVAAISLLVSSNVRTRKAYLCTHSVSIQQSTKSERTWTCGYRNAVMLCSSLGSVPSFSNAVNNSINDLAKVPGGDLIQGTPTISYIQWLVERAWKMGYDREGASQLRNALVGTRKWIGTSEIYSLMHSLGIKVSVTDFPQPTGPDNAHPALMDMVESYFDGSEAEFQEAYSASDKCFPLNFTRNQNAGVHDTERLPLYFQYQGHSLTIVGIECIEGSGARNLLVLDPGTKIPDSITSDLAVHLQDEKSVTGALKQFRFPESALKSKSAYQVLQIDGICEDSVERELRKTFRTRRIVS